MLVLAHATTGLVGDGVPGALLYAGLAAGAAITVAGLRGRGPRPVGGPAVPPLTVDGAERGPWPGDRLPAPIRVGGQVLGLLALAGTLVVGWAGSPLVGLNPTTLLVASVFWWSVPALSLVAGDWWRVVDPFDALAALVERRPRRGRGRGGDRAGAGGRAGDGDEAGDWWVPAALLASFAWVLTCWPDGYRPRSLAGWLTAFTAVMVVGAVGGGRAWVRRNEPFAVLCGTLAAAAPVAWDGGRVRLRSPLAGLAGRAGGRRTLGVLAVVLGTTVWEATAGTQWWADLAGTGTSAATTAWATVSLAWCVLGVAAAWAGGAAAAAALAGRAGAGPAAEPLAPDLAPTLGPLVVAATLSHQITSLLLDGQNLLALASDPLARGWDLLGTIDRRTNDALLSGGLLAWTQLTVLAAGLALGLVAGWDRLASRSGRAVLDAGWAVAGWTVLAGSVALGLLLGA